MSRLRDSWNAFSPEIAARYLKSFGYPSHDSKQLVLDILKEAAGGRRLRLLELGCGNGQLAEFLAENKLGFEYTGVDFSEPLLEAGRKVFATNDRVRFIRDDAQTLEKIDGHYDYAIFSHVVEMLSSPQTGLRAARRFADKLILRLFEPPEQYDVTTCELHEMDLGQGPVPYLRWKMGQSFYQLMLSELGATRVDIYRSADRDQLHVVHFD
jgi:ubiquinone/menaquinone biosynthesis C-methylase UbiE